jgi:hypothetical protein
MVFLYIKSATLPLQHLATFSSPIRCHRRRCVLFLRRRRHPPRPRRHPPRPPPSTTPPILCPTGFFATGGLPKSAVHRPTDALASRHAVGSPPSAPRTRPASSRPAPASGAPHPHNPRVVLLPILLLCAVLPSLRGSAAAARRVPYRLAGLRVVTSARASTSPCPVGRGAPPPRLPACTPTLPGCLQIGSC